MVKDKEFQSNLYCPNSNGIDENKQFNCASLTWDSSDSNAATHYLLETITEIILL